MLDSNAAAFAFWFEGQPSVSQTNPVSIPLERALLFMSTSTLSLYGEVPLDVVLELEFESIAKYGAVALATVIIACGALSAAVNVTAAPLFTRIEFAVTNSRFPVADDPPDTMR